MKKLPKENYVTQSSFDQAFKGIDVKFDHLNAKVDKEVNGLHQKINNVAHSVLMINERLERVENTMATKSDIQIVLNHIDAFTKRVSVFEQEEGVQSLHLNEVREKVNDHEKRLVTLESAR